MNYISVKEAAEKWSVSEVETFCEKYGVKLTVVYQETDEYEVGSIIRQSRKAKDRIIEGASLTITIAKELKTGISNSSDEEVNSGNENILEENTSQDAKN